MSNVIVESYSTDSEYEARLLISTCADKAELCDNIRCAKAILKSFPIEKIVIRGHSKVRGMKNPEYIINNYMADRKGIAGYKGVRNGFQSAIGQGAKIVVIDLDKHLSTLPLRISELSRRISWRYSDFVTSRIVMCYVVYHGQAVRIDKESAAQRKSIEYILKKLKP